MSQIAFKEKPLTFLSRERQGTMQHMPPQSYLQLPAPLTWILPQCLSARTSAVITLWISYHHMVVMKSSGELLSLLIDYIGSWQLQWSSTRNDIPWIHKHQMEEAAKGGGWDGVGACRVLLHHLWQVPQTDMYCMLQTDFLSSINDQPLSPCAYLLQSSLHSE